LQAGQAIISDGVSVVHAVKDYFHSNKEDGNQIISTD